MKKLKYNNPAEIWEEALPIGNGRIGGMVFSGTVLDRIQINEESLWSGQPYKNKASYKMEDVEKIREYVFAGDYSNAQRHLIDTMHGGQVQAYGTFGQLFIETVSSKSKIENYYRELDMETGIVKTTYTLGGKNYCKEAFVSLKDDVMVINIKCDKSNFNVYTSCLLMHSTKQDENDIAVSGKCPCYTENINGNAIVYDERESICFKAGVKIISDGHRFAQNSCAELKNVTDMTVIFSIASSFNGHDKMPQSEGKEYKKICDDILNNAVQYSYDELKRRHIAVHSEMFNRVQFTLGVESNNYTDERLESYENDLSLIELLFDFGRYLYITSSQKNTLPANLQGIWNKSVLPPWACDFHFNINLQMNYWAVEACNLPECHMPVFKMLKEYEKDGNQFGLNGWSLWHTSDIWHRNCDSTKEPRWGYWPMGGIWMCRHIWEHYLHTQDIEFLKEHMYILINAVEFLKDWMVEDSEGYLTTCPSTSPENTYFHNGEELAVCSGSAMDLSMICDILTYIIEAGEVLRTDTSQYREMLSKIKPLQIGSDGRLLEWNEELEEAEKFHRHLSHLYGVYPANTITGGKYFDAAYKSLEYRLQNGGGQTGWSNAWIANLYARFGMADEAYDRIKTMFKKSIYPNMFDAHPPFQIDGNFGICAAIIEMIVQSHKKQNGVYYIDLLPAIPDEWVRGHISGIKVRGGHELDINWVNKSDYVWDTKEPTSVKIKSGYNGEIKCRYAKNEPISVSDENGNTVEYILSDGIVSIQGCKDKTYEIIF